MQQNNNNTQQQRQQRYIVNWDCSNQNKRYTIQEKQFIKHCYENGMNPISIAKQLKRGLWAIEVQIMYLKTNHRNNHKAPTTFYPRNRSIGSHRPQIQHLKSQIKVSGAHIKLESIIQRVKMVLLKFLKITN